MELIGNWKDIKPISEQSEPSPVSPMVYTEACNYYIVSEVLGYFRAILAVEEVSERAFELTEKVIRLTPGFYAAWHYRRYLFYSLKKDFNSELSFLAEQGKENPKNYQVWHYRKDLLSHISDWESELEYTKAILDLDERNVHAWGYRQLITSKFSLWDEEKKWIENFIERYPRNNSAWNYKYYLVIKCPGWIKTHAACEIEIKYCMKYAMDCHNESCFAYAQNFYSEKTSVFIKENMCDILMSLGSSIPILRFLLFIYISENLHEICKRICSVLTTLDQPHSAYWSSQLQKYQDKPNSLYSTLDQRLLSLILN